MLKLTMVNFLLSMGNLDEQHEIFYKQVEKQWQEGKNCAD